jgi:AcrR family transcriptional regulator
MQVSDIAAVDPPARRGRGPSPAKTAATRRALVQAGLSSFLEKGFADTRMSDVAARAGLAKGTAYLHFPDKAGLFAEVLRDFVREAAGRRPVPRPGRGEPTLHFLRRTVVPILRELQASDRFRVLYLVVSEGGRFPELAAVYRAEAIDPVLRVLRAYLARAERRGELRSGALARLPVLFASPVIVGALWNNLFGRDQPLDVASLFESFIGLAFSDG